MGMCINQNHDAKLMKATMSFTLFQIHWQLFVIFAEKFPIAENINHTFQFNWRYSVDYTCNSLHPQTDA